MQTANDLLYGILTTVGQIERNQKKDQKKEGGASKSTGIKDIVNISSALSSFAWVRPKTVKRFIEFSTHLLDVVKKSNKGKDFKSFSEGLIDVSTALPNLVAGLKTLGNIRSSRVDRAIDTLNKLYDMMYELGDGRKARKIERAINIFDKLGRTMRKVGKPLKLLSTFMMYLGLSFVVFAAGIVAASAMLKLSSPLGVMGAVVAVVVMLAGVMLLMTFLSKFVQKGIDVIKDIGKGFLFLTLGLMVMGLGLIMLSSFLGTGNDFKGIGKAMLVMAGVVVLMVGMFVLLGFAGKFVDKGIKVASGMGLGFLIMIAGIFIFATGLVGLAALMGASGDGKGIAIAMGIMALTIGAMVGMFWLLGKSSKQVAVGVGVSLLVAVGIAAIGMSVKFLFDQAGAIGSMMGKKEDNKTSSIFGIEVPPAIAGLGMIGTVFLGAVAAFALLGIPAVAWLVGVGAGVAIMVAGALLLFAVSAQNLITASSTIPANFPAKLGLMIGGVFEGMMIGFSTLAGGDPKAGFLKKTANIIKNSAKIFLVTGILMAASISLSMFARALGAFASLSEMRVIKGTDKDGNPIFGDKVNVTNVSGNISSTISGFLKALIESTDGLTRSQSAGIARMGKALTGKNGILSGVVQFTDVLKAYAQFGAEGKIGYSVPVLKPDGTIKLDKDGNPIMKQESVLITDVSNHIISSFTAFVEGLTSKSSVFEIDGREGRKMANLAEVLLGKKGRGGKEKYGLLQPIQAFSETLTMYAKYGADLKLPIFNDKGEVIDTVPVETIANNIVNSLVKFTETIGTKELKTNTKQAEANLGRFSNIMDLMGKLGEKVDGLTRLSNTIKDLGTSFIILSAGLEQLDTLKLAQASDIGKKYLKDTNAYGISIDRIESSSASSSTTTTTPADTAKEASSRAERRAAKKAEDVSKANEPNWEVIAAQIGESVGSQIVQAMKTGQMKFQFSGNNEGVVEYG